VSVPIDLKPFWYSDLKLTPLNAASYQNPEVDKLILELNDKINERRKNEIYKRFQEIIHNDQPVSFQGQIKLDACRPFPCPAGHP
jgi:peptide/nickel transport system substrate-binding protein